MNMQSAECPICGGSVPFNQEVLCGELTVCPDCNIELEVTAVTPLTLSEAPQEAEDWGQ